MKEKSNKKTNNIPENQNDMEPTRKYKIKKTKKHPKFWKVFKISILVLLLIIIIVAGVVIGKLYEIWKKAKLDMKEVKIEFENSVVNDISGSTIAILSGDENRDPVRISEMSQYIPKAFVAIEDERFYEHSGVDIKRSGAATLTYILNGGESSFGGSTITQQMIKNITDESDRTWQRKVKEMARAYYIEQEMSKTEILELYLNLIFLGGKAYGVEVASQYYFSKSASDLTLAESAFLAGINNAPNLYSPFSTEEDDINQIKRRTKIVLDKMYQLGQEDPNHKAGITQQEYDTAIAELEKGLVFTKGTISQNIYSYHTEAAINQVKEDLKEKYDYTEEMADTYIKSGGLTIYTTQNTEIQNIMEEEVAEDKYITYSRKTKDDNGDYVTAQTAMVLMNHKTGYVLATVGAIGEKDTSFGLNRATQSVRQPGSSIKPLAVLCPGIDNGIITGGTVYDDIPYSSGKYSGFKNYSYYMGLTTLRYATAQSQNIPMLKAINDIGIEKSVEFLESAGITSIQESQYDMTIALGSTAISPLEMAAAYAAVANDGVYIEPTFYTKVLDSEGNVILEAEQETRTVMSAASAYIVKEILTEVVRSGALSYTALSGISVGAKTGTSSDDYDRWVCGFTPYYTAATWYGFDYNETVRYNGNPAGLIWDGVMEPIHKGLDSKKFSDTRPSGVTTATICKCSGKLATKYCKNDPRGNQVYTEYFLKGTVPREECTCHVGVDVCVDTGLIANDFCTNRQTKVFITRASTEKGNWKSARDAEYMLITEKCKEHTKPKVEEPKPEENTTQQQPEGNDNTNGNITGENVPEQNTTGGNTIGGNTVTENTTGDNTQNTNNTTGTTGNTTGGNTTAVNNNVTTENTTNN